MLLAFDTSNGQTAEVMPIQSVDARPSTTKILGPGPHARYALAAGLRRPSTTDSFLKKVLLSSFFSFSRFFSSAPCLGCSCRFSSALLILPFCQKIHFMHAVEVVTRDNGHRKAQALTCIAGVTADSSRRQRIEKL